MSQPLNNKGFIEKAIKVHGDKYDYSKVEYIDSKTPICIVCPEHGEFWQLPHVHLKSSGCPHCGKEIKRQKLTLTTEEFIKRAKQVHGDKYDYSKVEYKDSKTKICIICPKHGEFWQTAYIHLNGGGCPRCAKKMRGIHNKGTKTTEEFIRECIQKYGDRYDFSKTIYNGAKNKIIVFDKAKNKEIITTPTSLLSKGYSEKTRLSKNNFIEIAQNVHNNKYDYSFTNYVDINTKIKYICPIHGEVEQLPRNHLRYGCRFCSKDNVRKNTSSTTETFIEKAKKVHGVKYDYSKVNYINNKTKVCIICPIHGEFWQTPSKHLQGHGCSKCKRSYLEDEIALFLNEKQIKYIEQYTDIFLKNGRGKQKLDFYLPDYKIAIECQGLQHFSNVFYIKSKPYENFIKRDIMKYEKCKDNGIKLLYYTTNENIQFKNCCYIYKSNNLFANKDLLFNEIKNCMVEI